MGSLSEVVKVRVDRELREALGRQAVAEGREVSQLVRVILRERMVADGQLSAVVQRD